MADIFHWGKGVIRNEKLYGLGIPPRLSYGSCHMQVKTKKEIHTLYSSLFMKISEVDHRTPTEIRLQ